MFSWMETIKLQTNLRGFLTIFKLLVSTLLEIDGGEAPGLESLSLIYSTLRYYKVGIKETRRNYQFN